MCVTGNFGVREYSAILYMCEGKVLMDLSVSKDLVSMAQLIRQDVLLARSVPSRQSDRMKLSLLNNLAGHAAHHLRDSATLIPQVRHNTSIPQLTTSSVTY